MPGSILLQKGQGTALTASLELPDRLDAPVHSGDAVGTVQVRSGETLLGEYPVTAAHSVEKLNLDGALRLLLERCAAG